MIEKIPMIAFILTLLFNGLILRLFILSWKNKKSQEFDNDLIYIGFGKRFLAFLIDVCIWYLVTYILREILLKILPITEWVHAIVLDITIDMMLFCIVTFFVVKYGGTPGKSLLKIRIVTIHGDNLSVGRAFLRQLITITATITLTLQQCYIVSIFMRFQEAVKIGDFSNIYDFQADVLMLIISGFVWLIIFLSDVLLMLTDKRKRAIHDYLANSIVVQK